MTADSAPVERTPDGRYITVRGRLWRASNPYLSEAVRQQLVDQLMAARRAVAQAKKAGDLKAEAQARAVVDAAKHALGERGDPWWTDGAPDYNRRLVKTTPYALDMADRRQEGEQPAASSQQPAAG